MTCELTHCIYNKNLTCISPEIQINSLGMCEDCAIITIPDEKLDEYKNKRLEEIRKHNV